MADFSNFELGMNVQELAGGLLAEMAEVFEIDLENGRPEDIGRLVGEMGSSKVLQENISRVREKLNIDQDGLTIAAGWLGRSGVQLALDRSLWLPNEPAPPEAVTILTGAVANWQDRAAYLVADKSREGSRGINYLPAGIRVMNTPTEIVNDGVDLFFSDTGRYPTEIEYARAFVAPILEAAGNDVVLKRYETTSGDEIAERFIADYPDLFKGAIRFARVANAGIQLAGQFVRAARRAGMAFDVDRDHPQAYVLTDQFPIAQTPQQQANPKEFQNPLTGIRQVAVTAKEIVSLAA